MESEATRNHSLSTTAILKPDSGIGFIYALSRTDPELFRRHGIAECCTVLASVSVLCVRGGVAWTRAKEEVSRSQPLLTIFCGNFAARLSSESQR